MAKGSSKNSSSTRQEDRRAAAQEDGVAISGDVGGSIAIDMVPDEVIALVQDAQTGAADLVTSAIGAVNQSQATVAKIAENTQPNGQIVPVLIAVVVAIYFISR